MRKAMELTESEGNTGDHKESLKTLDENAITDKNLINTVEGRMGFLKDIGKEVEPDEVDEELDTPIPDVPEDEPEEENGQAAVKSESNTESEAEENKDGQDTPVSIPDAYVRAAIHQGWKQEDVDDLVKQNPELALKTLTSTYNSTVNANKEWSALGRAKIDQERVAAETHTATQALAALPNITPAEAKKLREEYGDDPAVIKLIENAERVPANSKVEINVQQPADLYRTATARANVAANASVDQTVATFFTAGEMSAYEEFYGKVSLSQSINDLTNGQQEHRLAVLEHAEQIMTGMRMRGMNPTVPEVLEKAHLIVTEPIREQVIRSNLKKSALQRKKGTTLRPSKSKKSGSAVNTSGQQKPRNKQELVSKVSANLTRIFGSQD